MAFPEPLTMNGLTWTRPQVGMLGMITGTFLSLLDHNVSTQVGVNCDLNKDTIVTRLRCNAIDVARVGQR